MDRNLWKVGKHDAINFQGIHNLVTVCSLFQYSIIYSGCSFHSESFHLWLRISKKWAKGDAIKPCRVPIKSPSSPRPRAVAIVRVPSAGGTDDRGGNFNRKDVEPFVIVIFRTGSRQLLEPTFKTFFQRDKTDYQKGNGGNSPTNHIPECIFSDQTTKILQLVSVLSDIDIISCIYIYIYRYTILWK